MAEPEPKKAGPPEGPPPAVAQLMKRIATEEPMKLLISLSIPATISMLINAFYNVVDSIFVGRYSTEGLTSISLVFPFQMLIISIGIGNGVGAASLISRLMGMKQINVAKKVFENMLFVSELIAIGLVIIFMPLARPMANLFSDNEVVVDDAAIYCRLILAACIVYYPQMVIGNSIRAQGNMRMPLIIMTIGAVSNIILDPFLIFGWWGLPEMGVAGAGLATLIARTIATTSAFIALYKLKVPVKPEVLQSYKINKELVKKAFSVGIPATLMQATVSVQVAAYNVLLLRFGDAAIATAGVWFRVQSFAIMPTFGIMQGFLPIFGFAYGAKNGKRMKEVLKAGMILTTSVLIPFTLAFCLLPRQIFSMFTDDEEVR